MTTLYACTLTAVIAYSAGWCHGHATSRVRHVRIPTGCHCRDTAEILAADIHPALDPHTTGTEDDGPRSAA